MNRVRFGFLVSLCVVSQLASALPTTEQYACMPGSVLAKDTQLQSLAFKVFAELEVAGTEYSDVAYKLHNLIDWMALKGGRPPKNFKQKCLQFKKELALVPLEKDMRTSIVQLIDKASRKRVGLSASAKWGIGLGSAAVFMALAAVVAHVRGKRFMEPPAPPASPVVALGVQPAQLVVTAPPVQPVGDAQDNGAASGVGGDNDDVHLLSFANGSLRAFNHTLAQILAVPALDDFMEDTRKQLHSLRHVAIHAGVNLGACIDRAFDLSEKNRDAILEQIDISKALSQEMRTIILNYAFSYIIDNSTRDKREVLYPKLHWFLSKFDFDVAQDAVVVERESCVAYDGSWLEIALSKHNTGVINFLVDEKRFSIDQLDRAPFCHGVPLCRAVEGKDRRMIELLLTKGARSDIPIDGRDTVDQLVQADPDLEFKTWFLELCKQRGRYSPLRQAWMGTVRRVALSRKVVRNPDRSYTLGPVASADRHEEATQELLAWLATHNQAHQHGLDAITDDGF